MVKQCDDNYQKLTVTEPDFLYGATEFDNLPDKRQNGYVITDDSTYKGIFDMDDSDLPNINFSKQTLIGKHAILTCSEDYYVKKACINKDQSHVIYTVKIDPNHEGPICRAAVNSMNWAIVPVNGEKHEFEFNFDDL